jgi:hypothetical protein
MDIPSSCTKAHVYPASDQPSEAEIKQGEEEAATNVRNFAVGCVLLYFSKSARDPPYGGRLLTTFGILAPHLIAYVKQLL